MRIAESFRQSKLLQESGWLPHYSTPLEIVAGSGTSMELRQRLAEYYKKEWKTVRSEINKTLKNRTVDNDAKTVFRQALIAHGRGLYIAVPRMLFPEIERVMRAEFGLDPLERVTSQEKLKNIAGELGFSETEPGGLLSLSLFEILINHLYVRVEKRNLEKITSDLIPNRHAAMHGYVTYNSAQSSLNSIFITDYIFQVIQASKENAELVRESA
jgi:hypothetical protein